MVKHFWKKTWVFVLAACAVVASTALLSFGIKAARAAEMQGVEHIDTPAASLPPVATSAPVDDFVLPEILLAYTADRGSQPAAKDIGVEDALKNAARPLMGVFGAQLDGRVCKTTFYNQEGSGLSSRGIWDFRFDDYTRGAFSYSAQVDSISGEVLYLQRWRYYPEEIDTGAWEMEIPESTHKEFVQLYTVEARKIVEEYFAAGRGIIDVIPDAPGYYDGETNGYTTRIPVSFRVILSDGATITLDFTIAEGGLTTVYYTPSAGAPEQAMDKPMAESAEPEPAEAPAEEALPTPTPVPTPGATEAPAAAEEMAEGEYT